jgi:hypothetical protein
LAFREVLPRVDKIKRVIQSEETKAIIDYLRKHPGSTIDKVAKHLQQEKICSRLTTLYAIEKLLAVGLIKDDRRGKYFHSLSYDEGSDFRELASAIMKRDIKENLNIFDRLVFGDSPTKDQVKELHDYLDEAINEHYKSEHLSHSELWKHEAKKKSTVSPTKTRK